MTVVGMHGRLTVFDYAEGFKNGITQVKNEKAKHKWNGIATVDQHIGDHYNRVGKKFDDDYQKKCIDEFYKSLSGRMNKVIKREEGG